MNVAVRGKTLHAGFDSLLLGVSTNITQHHTAGVNLLSFCTPHVSICQLKRHELRCKPRNESVDLEMWSSFKCFLTDWTLADWRALPVGCDTGQAEVVSTWSGNWLSKHVQTDGTKELLLRQETDAGSHF